MHTLTVTPRIALSENPDDKILLRLVSLQCYDDDACHCVKSQDEEGHQDGLGGEEADGEGEHQPDVVVRQDHHLTMMMVMMMVMMVMVMMMMKMKMTKTSPQ